MAVEIERKFLLKNESWRGLSEGMLYRQGYLCTSVERTVRVRVAGTHGFITIKGQTHGMSRVEFEYTIPVREAEEMLNTLAMRPLIEKKRYRIPFAGLVWEVDEFLGENAGLIIAEVELEREDQRFERPEWLGDEVTHEPKYYNANLALTPFRNWEK